MTTINLLGNGLSGVTGSGNFVGSTNPALVTPALGTPSSGVLTNCTSLPAASINSATVSSYTPAIGDGTNNFSTSTATGNYITISNVVWFWAWIVWTGKGSAASGSPLRFSLPVTTSASMGRVACTIGYCTGITYNTDVTSTNSAQLNVNTGGGNNILDFYTINSNGTTAPRHILVSNAQTTGEIQITGQLFV